METPCISVILPSLNVAEYIDETIDSVIKQSLNNIEIICVDAGSTDGTLDIIKDAAKDDPRIRLIISDKRSYGYQVNLGIDSACGEYIAVLETDDYIETTMYEKLYEVARSAEADYAKADYDAFFSQTDGSYYFFPRHTFKDDSLYDRVICPKDHESIGRDDWYLWQGIYSRDFLRKNNIRFSETSGAAFQDIGFLFWTGLFARRAVYVKDILYHYRIDRDGASSNLGKGLRYSYTEFSLIKEKINKEDHLDLKGKRLLYARMVKSFVSAYSHISEDEKSITERRDAYQWFRREMKNAYDEGILDEKIILPGHVDRLECLMESESKFFQNYSTKGFYEFIQEKSEFVIFGCGDFGYKASNILLNNGKKVAFFLDNNMNLWGKTINGIDIHDPEEIKDINDDINIIIANEAYYKEIRTQLIDYGITPERIYVFK